MVAGVLGDVWPVTAVGAAGVATGAGWHAVALVRQMRRALPARFGTTVRYYVAASCMLPVGAYLGVLMARGVGDPLHVQMMLAHAAVNLLGWMGLTVIGTLVTLWPTMLRTRIAEGSERAAQRALPVLVGAVAVIFVGALAGQRLVAAAGLATYLGGLVLVARPFVAAARGKPPAHFPTLSVLAGVSWLAGCVGFLAVGVGTAGYWHAVHDRVEVLTPALAAGFGAQVLLGALSYLIPVALGGGPTPVRAANAALDRGGPAPGRARQRRAAGLPAPGPAPRPRARLLAGARRAGVVPPAALPGDAGLPPARKASAEPSPATRPRGPAPVSGERTARRSRRLAGAGLAAVLLAVAAGVAFDSTGLAGDPVSAAAGVNASGETRTVQVEAQDMRFVPDRIEVPAGTRLLIEVTNADDGDVHDLVLDTGADTGRLAPGETATLDVGVVGRDLDGWCSVLGHRRMGMVLAVGVTGGAGRGSGPRTPPARRCGDPVDGSGLRRQRPRRRLRPTRPRSPTCRPAGCTVVPSPSPRWSARSPPA